MSSGDDIQAGRVTGADSITDLAGEDGDTGFSGDVILRVGANVNDRPFHTLDGIRALGWSGIPNFGPGPKGGGTGVVGVGGPVGGIGLIGVAGGKADGVVGTSDANAKSGVFAFNPGRGAGVRGYSGGRSGVGVFGKGAIGVQALADTIDGIGVIGFGHENGVRAASDIGVAGEFHGGVSVEGNFRVYRGVKSTVVPHHDGSHRQLYCMESPESWFEDFGEGKLIKGNARVQLDSGFASVVQTNTYHVFLTPYGDSNGLYVARRSKGGFEVKEQRNGKSSLSFSYRIVAKRKDVEGKRLAKVKVPKVPEIPKILKVPRAPEIPKVSKVPRVPEIPQIPKIPPQSVVYSASKGHEAKTPRAKRPK